MRYKIPYGDIYLEFSAPENSVIFTGEPVRVPGVRNFRCELLKALEEPIGAPPLKELAKGKKNIVFLIEDATRNTPVAQIMPIVTDYLNANGVQDEAISFLTAPGTHRVMTGAELREKLGPQMLKRFKVRQHDAAEADDMADLGYVEAGGCRIPVHINKYALQADLLVGIGSIVPHSDAGYSGGAKILQPGICDFATTAATHAAAGFCPDIPLGRLDDNPCRQGMEAVAAKAGLAFIINVVKNFEGETAGIFAGDFVKAHRAGAKLSERAFKVALPSQADILIASAYPADLDFWQASKGIDAAYFAVRRGGVIIFAARCKEGLASNHPRLRELLALPLEGVLEQLRKFAPEDKDADVISMDVAVGNCRARDRARIFCVSEGLSQDDCRALGYTRFPDVQSALDEALHLLPGAQIGILPQAGVTLPVVED